MRGPKPERCPKCGSTDVFSIVYGELIETADELNARKVVGGGCCPVPEMQIWRCGGRKNYTGDGCGHEWGFVDPEYVEAMRREREGR